MIKWKRDTRKTSLPILSDYSENIGVVGGAQLEQPVSGFRLEPWFPRRGVWWFYCDIRWGRAFMLVWENLWHGAAEFPCLTCICATCRI